MNYKGFNNLVHTLILINNIKYRLISTQYFSSEYLLNWLE
jgi:hypothetical protein